MSVAIVTSDDVRNRIKQLTEELVDFNEKATSFYNWQAGLTASQVEAIPAGPSGLALSVGDGNNIKGFANECFLLLQVRAGLQYVPQGGSPTVGTGYNFTSFFQAVVGIGPG